ncbi:MAG: hypothetical protein JMN27_12825 [gamma proteobacterium endosymbiont of Lamellibrachia anaximandri]|uniref:hypothetical protein n=1 Tax=endosymbiont of Lamellibrachia barhami TaxID=205975 RepID=UPI0015B1D7BC|nr:hypothetical protein [endosymbiont of Lamellibrachia barhami]MBA1446115.1 hypothetical protein [Gammaproteobacteria bacterium]MBL3528174.1 hypothetical protein [gamma proteobacterium endosymbiont of Lamellibrachia anaximandri]MBL3534705.1 hypothetical protein [gamma proteobacterium endosymbiont of Lamellibrachia anaximandri]MBL3589039.1 hypothetical protein [gamma proteobacterium endosymbiont of Lamellibrachia anaximandri]MBL3617520.1 hypothetical protein [gamma proteobacterium endosymbiont
MKQKLLGVLIVSMVTLFLAGCPHQAMVYNVEDASVVANKDGVTMDDVRKAIIRAGATLGWNMNDKGSGLVEGTIHLRSHMAQVDIPYDAQTYSIKYKNSDNLKYDGEKIHSNYNGWIQNLDRAIKAQLSTL